jgi:hypothetical protein
METKATKFKEEKFAEQNGGHMLQHNVGNLNLPPPTIVFPTGPVVDTRDGEGETPKPKN